MGERQRYSREFKLEAVRLLEAGQKPAAELARELGEGIGVKSWRNRGQVL